MTSSLDEFEATVRKLAQLRLSDEDKASVDMGLSALHMMRALEGVRMIVDEAIHGWGKDNPEVVMLCQDITKAVISALQREE